MLKLMMECSLMDALQYGVKSDLASFQARTIIWWAKRNGGPRLRTSAPVTVCQKRYR